MDERPYLGELEQMILWAVLRLRGKGYGPRILEQLEDRADRTVTPGALYATLDRLEEKGMIESSVGDPEPGRGGRPRRYVAVTAAGRAALAGARSDWMRLWDGLETAVES